MARNSASVVDGRHVVRQCKAGVICGEEGCTAKHSKLLHQSFERSGKENPGEQQAIPNPGSSSQQIESTLMRAVHKNMGRSS